MQDAIYGSVGTIYEHYYDISEDDLNAGKGGWSRIEFTPEVPAWLAEKRKR